MQKPKIAAVTAAVAFALSMGQPAQAVEIKGDSWSGSWDTTVSLGSSWRMEDRDIDRIGHANLAELEGVPIDLSRGAWSNNGDDANLNFDKNDPFSTALKFTTELGLQHESGFGFFIRGTGVRDFELMDNPENRRKPISEKAAENHGDDYRLLDAYVYNNHEFGESNMQWRLGRQVVSWGESTFIQHGLSEINAVDATKLRVPGSEIKEGLIPVNTLWSSMDLSETLSLEAYAQFEWEHFRTDEPGTYFATQDFGGETGTSIHLGFGTVPENTPGTVAFRIADRDARDDGQFGVKLAWLAEDWNYTEFGFYYVNYHNKRPLISAYAHDGTATRGFFEYLEDIQMYGLSFNTSTDGGLSIAGEMTYRKDEPLQIDDVEILFATLEPVGTIPSGTSQIPGGAGLGEEISGYRLFDTVQAQTTFTYFVGPKLGADQWVVLVEVGANKVLDMPSEDELRFNAPGTNRSGNEARAAFEGVETASFATDFSWGYRFVTRLDYTDVLGGWNLSPRLVLQHDVKGITPGPISNFVEDRKAVTLGVAFGYQSKWKIDAGYSAFFDGGAANLMEDKDFFAANVSYSF
ncbi:DUF1302 domain-containing protein [Aliikangiella sp. G2MR2-5]|uniref:DUF1302 domain-containing protein n=1 Tax=Aliikangiella sp. G2MR2-5 TaxID=2788943 RepID=UPI001FEDC22D|nr:DUF1302 domain-containing protein [Aliikangiella sp. G2MR2-5]